MKTAIGWAYLYFLTAVAFGIALLLVLATYAIAGGILAAAVFLAIAGIATSALNRVFAADEPVEAYAAPEGLNVVKLEARR